MAGNYPDVPSNRMAYDRDGTQAYRILSDNSVTQMSNAEIVTMNNEHNDYVMINGYGGGGPQAVVIYFPERRDLVGYFASLGSLGGFSGSFAVFEVSTNTTNGLDGTWTQIGGTVPGIPSPSDVVPAYRTGIITASALGIQALRFRGNTSWEMDVRALHLFGNVSPGQNPNRLAIWHPTSDLHVTGAYFDWGNAPRGSSADRTFRVKNVSSTLTANTPQVIVEALTDTVPSVPGQTTLSTDGTTFGAGITLADLAPGGLSPVCTVRRVTPSNAVLSVWAWRMVAQAISWT